MGAIAEGFVAFAQPLLDQTDGSVEELNKAFAVGQFCFNLALIPEDEREKLLSELRLKHEMDEEEFDAFRRAIVVPMVRRHQEMFPLMHRRISGDRSQRGSSLSATPRPAQRAETSPGIDRYAPCPCNSGEKYKFCCGAKRR
ncbi:MAG: YecA family protein [Isosphaerales bacterium]